jgi:iron complex outermembrane receptor protein
MMGTHLARGLLTGLGTVALAAAANAQSAKAADPDISEVVVTGSRTITNGNDSPNPVTVVTLEELTTSRPTTVFEALQDLPLFAGGKGGTVAGATGQGGNNNSIAGLNLRSLGNSRGLVLYDGHRVPPQNLDGTIDLNQIPQLLLQRVDVQTGGSSAVYGSDAITGVINFVTNRNFNGLKANLQSGISGYGDDRSYELGLAYGKPLFGGRGHFQGSVQYHDDAGLERTDRSYIQKVGESQRFLQGNGCAAGATPCVPFFITTNLHDAGGTVGGKINQIGTVANPYNGYDFVTNGVLTPFVPGTPVGVGNNQIGGNGAIAQQRSSLKAKQDFAQAYGRFDFDLTDNLHAYVTSFYDREHQFNWQLNLRSNGAQANNALTNGFRLTVDNAFLPETARAAMKAAGVTTFNLGKWFDSRYVDPQNTSYTNSNVYVNTGLEGSFRDSYKWELSYTGSHARQANVSNNTWDLRRFFAAMDSVLVNGQPTCWVATQPQFAGQYPGCVPMNLFGPSATTQAMVDYVLDKTEYVGTTDLQDVSGSIVGAPFSTWAGPVNVALSGERRKLTYELTSEAEPANVIAVNCAASGLLPARTSCVEQTATNIGTTTIFQNGTAGRTPVSQTVTEAALEADLPLLKDKPFARAVDLNLAGRHAAYSSSGSPVASIPYTTKTFRATTWKVGMDWHFNDVVTLRATRSRDFRAPNLSELFLPGRIQGLTTGTDFLTGAQIGVTPGYTLTQQVGGNPNLKPEVGSTTTVGVVLKPTENLSLAVDAFGISLKDAILSVDGSASNIQNACYDSGGSSPYCSLQVRPGGFSRTPANQALSNAATLFLTGNALNVAEVKTAGVDVEANYRMQLGGRPLSLRALASFQPHIWSVQSGTTTTDAGGVSAPRVRATAMLRYALTEALTMDWSTRWRSQMANVDPRLGLQVAPGNERVAPVAYSNLNLSYGFGSTRFNRFDVYLNVQNVFNQVPPPYAPFASASPFANGAGGGGTGFYPADDAIGRYFHLGVRIQF